MKINGRSTLDFLVKEGHVIMTGNKYNKEGVVPSNNNSQITPNGSWL